MRQKIKKYMEKANPYEFESYVKDSYNNFRRKLTRIFYVKYQNGSKIDKYFCNKIENFYSLIYFQN